MKNCRKRSDEEVLAWLRDEYEQPFKGWDFSHLEGRRIKLGFGLWNYTSLVADRIPGSCVILDQDTGGGEQFSKLLKSCSFSGHAHATEGYRPNLAVARKRLEPMGVEVHEVTDPTILPFENETFDLITNRHGMCTFVEEFRVLKPGGVFVTQQVGNRTNLEIHQLLDVPLPQPNELGDLSGARKVAEEVGFIVSGAAESYPITQYTDVGALVYYLKCIPWQIPDFSVERFSSRLLSLHRTLYEKGTAIDVGFHQYLLILTKPAAQI